MMVRIGCHSVGSSRARQRVGRITRDARRAAVLSCEHPLPRKECPVTLFRMRRSIGAALMVFAFVLQGTTSVLAGTTGAISGDVVDASTKKPITGARVSAVSPSQSSVTTTDASGRFSFVSLTPDTYTIGVGATAGYDAASISGVTVQADQTLSLSISQPAKLRQIGSVTSRAAAALVKAGTTADVYSINAVTQDKSSALGGGGTLNSAWSAISSVPGVYVAPNQQGYIGAAATLSIRRGERHLRLHQPGDPHRHGTGLAHPDAGDRRARVLREARVRNGRRESQPHLLLLSRGGRVQPELPLLRSVQRFELADDVGRAARAVRSHRDLASARALMLRAARPGLHQRRPYAGVRARAVPVRHDPELPRRDPAQGRQPRRRAAAVRQQLHQQRLLQLDQRRRRNRVRERDRPRDADLRRRLPVHRRAARHLSL